MTCNKCGSTGILVYDPEDMSKVDCDQCFGTGDDPNYLNCLDLSKDIEVIDRFVDNYIKKSRGRVDEEGI